jgi:hypothetical protein
MCGQFTPLADGSKSHEVLPEHGRDENPALFIDNFFYLSSFRLDKQAGEAI